MAIVKSRNVDAPILYKSGSIIFAQGRVSKYLYIVKSGEVRLVKFKGNSLTIVQVCKSRDILNEMEILTDAENELTAIAHSECEIVLVEKADIQAVMQSAPNWIPDIFKTLCERLKHTQEIIEEHNLVTDKNPELLLSKEDEIKLKKIYADYLSMT